MTSPDEFDGRGSLDIAPVVLRKIASSAHGRHWKGQTKEDMVTTAPVDEEKQAGFKPGIYKSVDPGDFTLTLAEDGTIGLAGKDVPKGPFEGCKDTGKTFGGDTTP